MVQKACRSLFQYLELVLVSKNANEMSETASAGLEGSEPLEEGSRVVSRLQSLVNVLGQNVNLVNRQVLESRAHLGLLDGAQQSNNGFDVLGLQRRKIK